MKGGMPLITSVEVRSELKHSRPPPADIARFAGHLKFNPMRRSAASPSCSLVGQENRAAFEARPDGLKTLSFQ